MHGGGGEEPARVAYRDVCREFGLTAASDETAWLIAADRAQEMGCESLADLMRAVPSAVGEWLSRYGSGYGDGDGSGYGYGSGDGYGSGSGSGAAVSLTPERKVRRFREGHDRVAICCDSGKSFRSQIWESYKANRADRGEAYRTQPKQSQRRPKEEQGQRREVGL